MQGWQLHDFWPRFCRGKTCHFVCFLVAACCLCDISCLLAGHLWNGEQCPGCHVYTHPPTGAPLSRISHELHLNCSWTAREHVVNSTWAVRELSVTVVALHALSSTGTHSPASSRRVHEQFAHSLRPRSRNFVVTKILNISKFLSRHGMQSLRVYAHFTPVYD